MPTPTFHLRRNSVPESLPLEHQQLSGSANETSNILALACRRVPTGTASLKSPSPRLLLSTWKDDAFVYGTHSFGSREVVENMSVWTPPDAKREIEWNIQNNGCHIFIVGGGRPLPIRSVLQIRLDTN